MASFIESDKRSNEADGSISNTDVLKFLNVVLDGVQEVFSVAVSTEVHAGSVKVCDPAKKYVADVVGTVGLISKPFHGTLILAFSMETYLKIMSKMLGTAVDELTPEIKDGAAELLNMIFGAAKANVPEFGLQKAIPTIFCATDIQIQAAGNRPSIVVMFTSELGNIYVEIVAIPELKAGLDSRD